MPSRKLTTVSDPATATNRLRAQAVIEFNDAHHIKYNKSDVWKHFNVSRSTGYRALAAAKRPPPDPDEPERRGRKRKIPRDEQRKLEEYLEAHGGVPPDLVSTAQAATSAAATAAGHHHNNNNGVDVAGGELAALAALSAAGVGDDTVTDLDASELPTDHKPAPDAVDGRPTDGDDDAADGGEGEGAGEGGKSGKGGSWTHVAAASGLQNVHWRTVRRAIGSLDYLHCLGCDKRWISDPIRAARLDVARRLLLERPAPEHWRDVCFTGTWHLRLTPGAEKKKGGGGGGGEGDNGGGGGGSNGVGSGSVGRLGRMPKAGERMCWKCVPDVNRLPEKDVWRIHCWAMVGYGFKSAIVFYEGPTMPTGDMNQKVYIEQILEPHVKPLAQQAQQEARQAAQQQPVPPGQPAPPERRIVLFEENEPGFGPVESGQNRARNWKEAHGVGYLFNAPRSKDLNILEECWPPMEEYVCDVDHGGDRRKVEEAIVKGWWERVGQDRINALVDSMPARLYAVLNHGGDLTEY